MEQSETQETTTALNAKQQLAPPQPNTAAAVVPQDNTDHRRTLEKVGV
jgi:hypothetical protein